VNGFVVARIKINALITTLATMQIVRGSASSFLTARRSALDRKDFSFSATQPF
jgi:ribose/xylose/arabinose/galactoside ABC-type transport system permease subunit